MNRKRIHIILCVLLTSILFWAGCKKGNNKKPLEIVGTGACEELLKKLAKVYNQTNPGYEVIVPPSIGSGRGIETVGNNEHILARVARPLKEDEIKLGLSYVPFARDPVVFAVGNDVNITSLTKQQLLDIFSGKLTNWRQVGGNDNPIHVLVREEGDSSLTIIEKNIPVFADIEATGYEKMAYHDYETVELFDKYHTTIGYLTKSNVDSNIHPVAFDGISPTIENVSQGIYPFICEYAFVYKEDRLNEKAQKFLDFVFSERGNSILKSNRVMPANGE